VNYAGSSGSSLDSVTSSILRGKVDEGGRTYAVYGSEGRSENRKMGFSKSVKLTGYLSEYGFPMDELELDRIDMCHTKYYALLEKKRFLAPIPKEPTEDTD